MTKQNVSRLFLAGLLGTLVMSAMMFSAPLVGLPKMDIAAMLGWMFQGYTAVPGSAAWWAGLVFYVFVGSVVLPFVYSALLAAHLPGPAWLKGAMWGIALWVLLEVTLMPLMDLGVFSRRAIQGVALDGVNFAAHLVYGLVFGAIAGNIAMHLTLPGMHREGHA
jgi:hypothetical protein